MVRRESSRFLGSKQVMLLASLVKPSSAAPCTSESFIVMLFLEQQMSWNRALGFNSLYICG
jgi:hypothetical protein